jgi:hypothetical protein
MRVGRGDGSTDDADACGLRTVRHTRPEVESMCMHTCGYGCLYIRTHGRLTKTHGSYPISRRLIKRTITHMREGLSGWYVTLDPPVCDRHEKT